MNWILTASKKGNIGRVGKTRTYFTEITQRGLPLLQLQSIFRAQTAQVGKGLKNHKLTFQPSLLVLMVLPDVVKEKFFNNIPYCHSNTRRTGTGGYCLIFKNPPIYKKLQLQRRDGTLKLHNAKLISAIKSTDLIFSTNNFLEFPCFVSVIICSTLFTGDQNIVEQDFIAHRPQLKTNSTLKQTNRKQMKKIKNQRKSCNLL